MKEIGVVVAGWFLLVMVLASSFPTNPKPVAASPVTDQSAEVAALKAELETLRSELAQAKSIRPQPLVVDRTPFVPQSISVATDGSRDAVCVGGSCRQSAAVERRVFVQRQPIRRLFGRRR